jgi:hypothetical protein
MNNEHIVSTFIYYYQSDNIEDTKLNFRQATEEPYYHLQDDDACMTVLFRYGRYEPLVLIASVVLIKAEIGRACRMLAVSRPREIGVSLSLISISIKFRRSSSLTVRDLAVERFSFSSSSTPPSKFLPQALFLLNSWPSLDIICMALHLKGHQGYTCCRLNCWTTLGSSHQESWIKKRPRLFEVNSWKRGLFL